MRPKITAVLPAVIPSTLINLVTPLTQLHREGQIDARFRLETALKPGDLDWADLTVFCRSIEPCGWAWMDRLANSGKPWIYDLDDHFQAAAADSEIGQRFLENPARAVTFQRYLHQAHTVRVYAPALESELAQAGVRACRVLPTVNWRLVQPPRQNRLLRRCESSLDQPVRIVYTTSRVEGDHLAEIFLPAVQRILADFGARVEVHFWGANPLPGSSDPRVQFHPFIVDYDEYMRRFSRTGYDIGLAPLQDDRFHRAKTNLKFREYGSCRIAGVFTDLPVYSDWVRNGETGLLVSNTDEGWYQAIAALITDQALREKMQGQAYDAVRRSCPDGEFARVWQRQIEEALASRPYLPADFPPVAPAIFFDQSAQLPGAQEIAAAKIKLLMTQTREGGWSAAARLLRRYFQSALKRASIWWGTADPMNALAREIRK